ncbi:MAG: hypothetical protein KAR20_13690 [Candidatus Heimdallarchaeota archaeon]|nr:hypothetical protein [Candidatus Heimdallarchaeota archaeon]
MSAVSFMVLLQNDIEGKEKIREGGYLVFDLEDIGLNFDGGFLEIGCE